MVAYSPYRLDIENVKAGKHMLDFTVYGTGINTFGALHNCDGACDWHGPESRRTENSAWCYEYMLKETGMLSSPVITIFE